MNLTYPPVARARGPRLTTGIGVGIAIALSGCTSSNWDAGTGIDRRNTSEASSGVPFASSGAAAIPGPAVISPDRVWTAVIRDVGSGSRIFLSRHHALGMHAVSGQTPKDTIDVVAVQGTSPRVVTVHGEREGDVKSVSWSGDGTRLIYEFRDTNESASALFSIGLTDATPVQLTGWTSAPTW
jgi:hypothetical protein